jgi:hypothetical protein
MKREVGAPFGRRLLIQTWTWLLWFWRLQKETHASISRSSWVSDILKSR